MRTFRSFVLAISIVAGAPALAKQPPGVFVPAGELAAPRAAHTATLLADGRVLIVGGRGSDHTPTDRVEIYDPSNGSITLARPMLEGRYGHAAALLEDGRVLIAGGNHSSSTEIWDPATGEFSSGPTLSVPQILPAVVRMGDGRVLVAGGLHRYTMSAAPAEIYDPRANAFTRAAPYAAPNAMYPTTLGPIWPTATSLSDGRVLLVGNGFAEWFDPATDGFRVAAPMASAEFRFGMQYHAVSPLADGGVLVTGGTDEMIRMRAADRFDPAAETFVSVATLAAPRSNHTSTSLAGGGVLLIGGEIMERMGPSGWRFAGSTSSTERFDPATNTFGPGPSLRAKRTLHTATLIADGSVLVVGGVDYDAWPASRLPLVLSSVERLVVPPVSCAKRLPGRCRSDR